MLNNYNQMVKKSYTDGFLKIVDYFDITLNPAL
jgi:hypothetical protein